MTWLTHLRTLAVGLIAFMLCCALVTQVLALAFGYPPALGNGLIQIGGARVYAPFSFLTWSMRWAAIAPSLLVLSIGLTLVSALAAYAVAVSFATLQPITLASRSPWRDLASWRDLGHYGLLRDDGLALGAVRRHPLASHSILHRATGGCVFLGEPRHSDDAVLAALASWPGTLVLVDARAEISDRSGRAEILRFAPGRSDTLCINPLLTIRDGLDAWTDARRLAAALLSADRAFAPAIDALALVMLDRLIAMPSEARTLMALRHRLADPAPLVAELCGRWTGTPATDAAPMIWDMLRAARALRAEPDRAVANCLLIDKALAPLSDAGLAGATSAHQLNLAEFVSAAAPRTLVLSMQGAAGSAPVITALLTQLAGLHASDAAAQPLLLAVEAAAARIIADQIDAAPQLPARPNMRVVLQVADIAHAERLAAGTNSLEAIIAIGPQSAPNAEAISRRGGRCITHEPIPLHIPRWRSRLFPTWVAREVERLPSDALKTAPAEQALLVVADQKPVRMQALMGGGASTYLATPQRAAHDWTAPPLGLTSAGPRASEEVARRDIRTTGEKLRRVLTRKSAPPPIKRGPQP